MQAKSRLTVAAKLCAAILLGGIGNVHASGYQVIYNFTGGYGYHGPPATPGQGPVFDPAGNLIGSSSLGGPNGYGSVYRITPTGQFIGQLGFPNVAIPQAAPLVDAAGDVFITSDNGRISQNFMYARRPNKLGERVSIGHSGDIKGPLIFDLQGNLVAADTNYSAGTVFSISLTTKTTTILHTFPASCFGVTAEGCYPSEGSLAIDAIGNLYGSTEGGGPSGGGTIYRIAPSGTLTTFYSFPNPTGCQSPNSGLVFGPDGLLYGTSQFGPNAGCIFKITLSGQFTLLHQFSIADVNTDPHGALVFDSAGNLYGTTRDGGPDAPGTLFKLAPDGTLTVLHKFLATEPAGSQNGYGPNYGLAIDHSGNLFGTTREGGPYDVGVVFKFAN